MIDPASRRKVADMPLDGHPESFQFDETGSRIFVNVPDAPQIAALMRAPAGRSRSSKRRGELQLCDGGRRRRSIA